MLTMTWGGDEMFKTNITNEVKHAFQFEYEEIEAFTYIDIGLVHDSYFSISINQNNYINSVTEIVLPRKRTKDKTSPLYNEEKKYRSVVSQLNWVFGILRPDVSL